MIAIFDYGAGNLRSVQNTLDEIGATYELVRDAAGSANAPRKIILPGVGHFGQMMRALDDMDVRNAFAARRSHDGRPVPRHLPGPAGPLRSQRRSARQPRPRHLPGESAASRRTARVPHMGWNNLETDAPVQPPRTASREHPYVYFAHSYYVPVVEHTAATCTYTLPYTAVLESGNIFGVQFHPEKSGPLGLRHREELRRARMLAKRIIPCLDVTGGRVVKGVNFVNLRDAGDPVELADRYNRRAPTNSSSSTSPPPATPATPWPTSSPAPPAKSSSRSPSAAASAPSPMPAASSSPAPTKSPSTPPPSAAPNSSPNSASEFGAQAVVLAIDARRHAPGAWNVYTRGGRDDEGIDAVDWAARGEALGAGEILLTSMDTDGVQTASTANSPAPSRRATHIPVIASGGAGKPEHFVRVLTEGEADAALAATIFHYGTYTVDQLKAELDKRGIPVRPPA